MNLFFMKSKERFTNILFLIFVVLIYAYIFNRNNQLYLLNPPDEFSFKFLIQSTDINNFDFSSPIYVLIYKIIFFFNDSFYSVAKNINLFFFFFGNLIIYIIAKNLINSNKAKLIFLISSLSSYNFYTTALMPEILFYTYFYFFILCYISLKNNFFSHVIIGLNIFILFCIKGIGLFLLPAIIVNEALLSFKNKERFSYVLKKIFIIFLSFLILFLIFKIYFINSSNFLFGSKYGNVFKEIKNLEEIFSITFLFLKNYFGHIYYNFFIFGLPFLIFFSKLLSQSNNINKIEFAPFIIILGLSVFASLNHAMYVFNYPTEIDVYRLTTRYYDFIIPLVIISSCCLNNKIFKESKYFQVSAILITAILFFWILFSQIEKFRPTFVIFDSILFRGYVYNDFFFNLFVIINFFIIISYFFIKFKSLENYIFIYIPIIILISSIPVSKEIKTYYKPNNYDLIGNEIKKIEKLKKEKVIILGNNIIGEDYRVLFHLNPKRIIRISNNNLKNYIENYDNIFLIDDKDIINEESSFIFMNGRYKYIE